MAITNYVTISKQIMKWGWYKDIPTKVLFIHLILKANYVEGKFKDIVVKRGQTVTSSQHLANETGLSRQQVRTAIDKLLLTNEITYEATNKYVLITLNNFEAYNIDVSKSNRVSNQHSNQQVTIKQPSSNHQVTTIEEGKEREERKEEYSDDSREMELSTLLLSLMKANNEKTKAPNIQNWCADISRMNRIDGHSMDDIETLIKWTQRDSFWKTNILSPSKLRQQFAQLWLKKGSNNTGKSLEDNMKILDGMRARLKEKGKS